MGKIYSGIGYLTGRRLTFDPDVPRAPLEDSKPTHSEKDKQHPMTNIGDISHWLLFILL